SMARISSVVNIFMRKKFWSTKVTKNFVYLTEDLVILRLRFKRNLLTYVDKISTIVRQGRRNRRNAYWT
ncbi:MAG: hypothetical protein K2M57_07955, partial [Paramuribaculum sp.]|nr:hypothetical protein [Paramuribaculum sp.]